MPRKVRKPEQPSSQRNGSNCLSPKVCEFDRINDITMITGSRASELKLCPHHRVIVDKATARNG